MKLAKLAFDAVTWTLLVVTIAAAAVALLCMIGGSVFVVSGLGPPEMYPGSTALATLALLFGAVLARLRTRRELDHEKFMDPRWQTDR